MLNKKIKMVIFILLSIIMIPTIVNANNNEQVVVLLDPGHGGYDTGAIYGNLYEKDVNWKIAKRVKEILDTTEGIMGILSRQENECPEINNRAEKAKEIGADLVVSFHINSSTNSKMRGSEVYVTRNTRLDRFYKNSNLLAKDILNNLYEIGIPKNGSDNAKLRLTESGNIYSDYTYADYYGIIKYPMNYGIPSLLIEHCFISNAIDRKFITSDIEIEKIAQANAKAIIKNKDLFKIDKSDNSVKGVLDNIYYDNNTGSIKGQVLYTEVINDMVADAIPKVSLVSEDGKDILIAKVEKKSSYTYSYDINILNIDLLKKYHLQIETNGKASFPNNSSLILRLPDKKLGSIYSEKIQIKNGMIFFGEEPYDGYMTNSPYTNITLNGNIMTGRLVIQEWLNGTKQIEPTTLPKVILKAENGAKIVGILKYIEPYVYEFKFDLRNIDKTLEYEMEVQCTNSYNISTHKDVVVKYSDTTVGKIQNYTMKYVNNKIVFEEIDNRYDGYMTNSPYTKITLNGNIMTGRLVIQEWLNGTKQIEPTSLPKVVLKSENGVEIIGTLKYIEPYVYEFKFDLRDIDETLKYEMEVQCTNSYNISTHKDVVVKYSDVIIGKLQNGILKIQNNKFILIIE